MAGSSPAMTRERVRRALSDHAHDVGLLHDQEILAVDLYFRARPFAEQHAIAGLQIDRDQLAALVAPARADSDDLALRGLLLDGVRNNDAALGLLVGIDAADDHAVVQGTKLRFGHVFLLRRPDAPELSRRVKKLCSER